VLETAILPGRFFIREVFVMGHKAQKNARGIFKHKEPDVKLADFSYTNDEVAQNVIVRAWTDGGFNSDLVGPGTSMAKRAKTAQDALKGLPTRPLHLKSVIVITEDEYDAGWDQDDPDQVIFVLPNASRQTSNLLEDAKFLMACVPNGI